MTVRNLDLTKMSLRLSVRRKATRGTNVNTLFRRTKTAKMQINVNRIIYKIFIRSEINKANNILNH